MASSVRICDPEGSGLLLPLTQAEKEMADGARAVIYILLLLYMFMGVGTVADCFMNAVEKIISKKRRILNQTKQKEVTYLVWNSTVADLTLLALGSSAPEILLSVLEICSAGFHSGELGPSTIVGSAAFNLLIILAVCICAIPACEVRAIEHMSVYHVTVIFSIFAYIWLLVIVQVISPNIVEIWEAMVTFVMFPILVTVSWLANKGKLEFLALEKRPEEEVEPRMRRSSQDDSMGNAAEKSNHPRLGGNKMRASMAVLTAGRKSHVTPEAKRDAHEEDKAIPAGSNGKDIQDPIHKGRIHAPHGIITFRSDAIQIEPEDRLRPDNEPYNPYKFTLDILRCNGTDGQVSCKLSTEGLSAVPGIDFEEIDETIVFEDGETEKQVEVSILPQRDSEPHDVFQLVLSEAEGDAFFNPNDDGGRGIGLLTITIKNSENPPLMERLFDKDNFQCGLQAWKQQILSSVRLEPEEAEEGEEPAGLKPSDYFFFVLGLPFKAFFGLVCPPAQWAGGYLLFTVALVWVAVVTALISDLASLFGCCAGIPDATTAITIVAMGTSLPDTFASMTSAAKDDTADSSIVNVTGSNSVNVYLGIGIPWLAAAIYWSSGAGDKVEWAARYGAEFPEIVSSATNCAFIVKAGALGFSVLIFNCVGLACLVLLRVRRLAFGGELGGPQTPARASSALLVFLWVAYIVSSIWRNTDEKAEVIIFPMAVLAALVVVGGVAFELSGKGRYNPKETPEEKMAFKDAPGENQLEDTSIDNAKASQDPEPDKIGAAVEEPVEPAPEPAEDKPEVPNAQEAPEAEAAPEVAAESVTVEVAEAPASPEPEKAEEAAKAEEEKKKAKKPEEKKAPKKKPKAKPKPEEEAPEQSVPGLANEAE
ncbi:unnamed protein product [Effrenium voratum]|uniref:Uncharacterized protein n=1 Tax=Effrenium voratum TaxID=2562239 RepID=A0AA36NJ62_9DINO|nr:unnamed protein product [Effrenium voratum]CAJ1421194.1 unnamed protein product [Effrenium voratum]